MEYIFPVLKYLFLGFFGLIGLLFVLALLFGKRMVTKWDYEADFLNDGGREIGEFEVKMSRIEKEEPEFTQKMSFRLRHPGLKVHSTVRVVLDGIVVMEGMVQNAGRVRLGKDNVRVQLEQPEAGQLCQVECDGTVLLEAPIRPD
jgi:hypothetical protein